MASGRVHFISNAVMGTGVAVWTYNNIPEATPYVIIGLAIGLMITPDYDLEGTTVTERMIRKLPVIGMMWQNRWYTYALLAKHRGYSHGWPAVPGMKGLFGLFWGTLSRLIWLILAVGLYFFIFITGAVYTLNMNGVTNWTVPYANLSSITGTHMDILLVIMIGWYLQDWNHYLLDFLFSEGKKKRHKHGKKHMEF